MKTKTVVTDKYIVNLCSKKSDSGVQWTPRCIITKESGKESQKFPLMWNIELPTESDADKYAVKEAKTWISKDSKVKDVVTQEEWFEDKVTLVIIAFFFLLSLGLITSMFITDL